MRKNNLDHDRLARKVAIDKSLKPYSLVLGIAAGIVTFYLSRSYWLSGYLFFIIYKFIGKSVGSMIPSRYKVASFLFNLAQYAIFGCILFVVYNLTGIIWLAVILSLVLGLLIEYFFIGIFFFPKVIREMSENGALDNDVVASDMRQRFTDAEWEKIRLLPLIVCMLMNACDDKFALNKFIEKYTTALVESKRYKDPLLRYMLHELLLRVPNIAENFSSILKKDAYEQLNSAFSVVSGELSHEEYKEFVISLASYSVFVSYGKIPKKPDKSFNQQLKVSVELIKQASSTELSLEEFFFEVFSKCMLRP